MKRMRRMDMGIIKYEECLALQRDIFDSLIDAKENMARGGCAGEPENMTEQTLILCEHPHVYTLGKSGKENNMLVDGSFLQTVGASFHRTDRGGDVTYHGPGQLVGYPILDLEELGLGLKQYIYLLEAAIIDTLAEFGIEGKRSVGAGVWLSPDGKRPERKISAIGVRSSRFVTMHGFSLNVNPRMEYFSYINPCGYTDRGVASIETETGRSPDMENVKAIFTDKFTRRFGVEIFV